MFETILPGAGSYPEPSEPKEELYQFEFTATIEIYGAVSADCIENATEMVEKGRYKIIFDDNDIEVTDTDIEVKEINREY